MADVFSFSHDEYRIPVSSPAIAGRPEKRSATTRTAFPVGVDPLFRSTRFCPTQKAVGHDENLSTRDVLRNASENNRTTLYPNDLPRLLCRFEED